MEATGSIFGITFFKRTCTGDGDTRNWCYLKQNEKRELNLHKNWWQTMKVFSFSSVFREMAVLSENVQFLTEKTGSKFFIKKVQW